MNLEDFRARARHRTAPLDAISGSSPSFETFIDTLRRMDVQEQKRYKGAIVIMSAVAVVLVASAARQDAVGVGLIAAVYMMIAGLSWMKSRLFVNVDYAGPTEQFLHNARKRYRFWGMKDTLFAVPGLILLAVGGASVVRGTAQKYLDPVGQTIALIVYAIFFALVVILGFIFSRSDWKKNYSAIMTEIQKMEHELANG